MPTFTLHYSNRIEQLTDALAQQLRNPRGGPLNPEQVIVQGRGMSLWLAHELSRRLGVWAGRMPYPRNFIEQLARQCLPPSAVPSVLVSESTLEWGIQSLWTELLPLPDFAPLRRYVEGDTDGLRRAQLCAHIATTFDQYLVARPELIRAWEAGKKTSVPSGQAWQPLLWRHLAERLRLPHLAQIELQLVERLRELIPPADLPSRVTFFGLSTLPPLYVRVLAALSRHLDIHLYLFSPSDQPWQTQLATADAPARVQVDNRLVASLGFLGADFRAVLKAALDAEKVTPVEVGHYEVPTETTLLSRLHKCIFALTGTAASPSSTTDDTISVHSCHGPTREVEVLRDQLLALTSRSENPVPPEEIVVLCPDIETYAPVIDAVFSRSPGEADFLPFHVSDRSSRSESPVFEALFRLLLMVNGRVTATEVTDLLKVEAVQQRFGMDPAEVDRAQEWIRESGLCWGINAEHRARQGLPKSNAFTWTFGLQRLLLGYAMLPGEEEAVFEGVLPFDQIEGQDAQSLGKLVQFARRVFGWLDELQTPRPLPDWVRLLGQLCFELFADDPSTARQVARVRVALEAAASSAEQAGFTEDVDSAVIRDVLARTIDNRSSERGFLSGGIMFCALVPMRSIPYRVVGLLGMNDGMFPRSPRPLDFDLTRMGKRQPGDRTLRDDDRYLFLETLCAARERVIVTYTGHAIKDNKPLPPSVCLGELLDEVGSSVVVQHRLQGFNPAYFQDRTANGPTPSRLFSYSEDYAAAANALRQTRGEQPAFADGDLATAAAGHVQLDDLIRFFRSPAAFYLNRRLGIFLRSEDYELSDREPLEFDNLESWTVGQALLHARLAGHSPAATEARLAAEGKLPYGRQGHLLVEKLSATVKDILACTADLRVGKRQPPVNVDVPLMPGRHLQGTVDHAWSGASIEHTFSVVAPKHRIATWLRHLAVSAAGVEQVTALAGKNTYGVTDHRWPPLPPKVAASHLRKLLRLYDEGLSHPLPFLPMPSYEYFKALGGAHADGEAAERAIEKAKDRYAHENDNTRDAHAQRAFGDTLPPFAPWSSASNLLKTKFHEAALVVFGGLEEQELIDGGRKASGKNKGAERALLAPGEDE